MNSKMILGKMECKSLFFNFSVSSKRVVQEYVCMKNSFVEGILKMKKLALQKLLYILEHSI